MRKRFLPAPLLSLALFGLWLLLNHSTSIGHITLGALLGWAIALLERSPTHASAALRPLGMGVLALTLLGIVLMPASGFWLALPPALALCRRTPQA